MSFLCHEADGRVIELIDRTNYPLIQVNGQRIYGPPGGYDGKKPPRGSELFCGRLPRDIYEDVLVPLFSTIAPIYQLRLMMDFSGTNRGFCFVSYWKPEDADRALTKLNGYEIAPGRYIGLYKSVDNCRLFFGNLPLWLTKEKMLHDLRSQCSGIVDITMSVNRNERCDSQAYAFVDFEDHRAAAMARKQFRPAPVLVWGNNIRVDWADPEPVELSFGDKTSNLHIRFLPPSITETDIYDLCMRFTDRNELIKVKKIKNFAFIECDSNDVAILLKSKLEGYKMGDFVIHVAWSKSKSSLHEMKLHYYQDTFCTSLPAFMKREIGRFQKIY